MTTMAKLDLTKLQYVILPGQLTHHDSLRQYYNLAYVFYKKIWQRIFNRLDGTDAYDADNFFKSTHISLILYENTVVSQLLCRELHLDNLVTYDIKYFKPFLNKALEDLKLQGVKKVLTLEANAINPNFSFRRTNVPFTEISMHLSIKLAKYLGMECCTGTPRTLTGVQNTATQMGFKTFEKNIISHNCPVDIVLCYINDYIEPAEPYISSIIANLWNMKIDYRFTDLTNNNSTTLIYGEKTA